jgi:hypothetical protein
MTLFFAFNKRKHEGGITCGRRMATDSRCFCATNEIQVSSFINHLGMFKNMAQIKTPTQNSVATQTVAQIAVLQISSATFCVLSCVGVISVIFSPDDI